MHPTPDFTSHSYGSVAFEAWKRLQSFRNGSSLDFDGESLDISDIVAISRHHCVPNNELLPEVRKRMESSIHALEQYLAKGYVAYGVNTGFGGSADSRTTDYPRLQKSLLQHTQSGVLVTNDVSNGIPSNQDLDNHSMPISWVKGTMAARCNSTVRGHSAVNPRIVEAIITLLRNDISPVIPLRGSISASGDLLPLSYVAGAIQGNPDIMVRIGSQHQSKVVSAKEALALVGFKPIVLGPKEGLGLINGTAASTALASLVIYDSHQLAILSQALTAMSAEALLGSIENYHPFPASVRPHKGQIEVARTIRGFLQGSSLIQKKNRKKAGLFQDRYPLRGASQWIGPQLEDLLLAHRQISVELNSTSDNPLVDVKTEDVISCANFQAASITSAMEKTRLSLQMIGKLLFGYSSELINSDLSNGLPSNLAADDPSLSFTMKGPDVNMASYMSELAFLANPVSSHVQSAEMHNQAINSLALISSRYSMESVEIVSLMSSTLLYVCCQALDLRVMHKLYLEELDIVIRRTTQQHFSDNVDAYLFEQISNKVAEAWFKTASMDLEQRCERVADEAALSILNALPGDFSSFYETPTLKGISAWKKDVRFKMYDTFNSVRMRLSDGQETARHLGIVGKRLYQFVRRDLGVPFHRGLIEHPCADESTDLAGRAKRTIGSWISVVYESLRDGRMHDQVMAVYNEAFGQNVSGEPDSSLEEQSEGNKTQLKETTNGDHFPLNGCETRPILDQQL